MDDAARVRVLERVAERERRSAATSRSDSAPASVSVGQRAARGPARRRGTRRRSSRPASYSATIAGWLQARGGERLALGARGDLLVVQLDALDGDDAVELLVVRQPDDAEGAVPEAPDQPVAAEDERRGPQAVVARAISAVCTASPGSPLAAAILPPEQEVRR